MCLKADKLSLCETGPQLLAKLCCSRNVSTTPTRTRRPSTDRKATDMAGDRGRRPKASHADDFRKTLTLTKQEIK